MDFKDIGKQIKRKRVEKNWRQEDLAEYTNLSVPYIGMIERGEKLPRLETFILIANVLGASADELLANVLTNGYALQMAKHSHKLNDLSSRDQKILYEIIEIFIKNATGN